MGDWLIPVDEALLVLAEDGVCEAGPRVVVVAELDAGVSLTVTGSRKIEMKNIVMQYRFHS